MPTKDTKEYKNLFDYKNYTTHDYTVDEDDEYDGRL